MKFRETFTRREFLKYSGLCFGSVALQPWLKEFARTSDFPTGEYLGRVCWGPVEMKARPSEESETVATLYEDAVVVRLREVIGGDVPYHRNRKWIETPDGYLWSPPIQPVLNATNLDTASWASQNLGEGFWAEVTVPYVDGTLVNTAPISVHFGERFKQGLPLRFYYSEILWIDDLKQGDDGKTYLRVNEKYGNPGDILWSPAEAFRPVLPEEITPINPDVEEKKVVVDLNRQELYCLEGTTEVYYCRVSSGLDPYGTPQEDYLTPLGAYPVWDKMVSTHMAGGTAVAGWDLPGIGWTSIFNQDGQAIHSTYWHNNFGEEMSNGCVNVAPADAKWIFRWGLPAVDYNPGRKTIQGYSGTMMINIIES